MKTLSKTLFYFFITVAAFSLAACGGSEEGASNSGDSGETQISAEKPAENPNRGTASADFGGKSVSVDYGRPELKGRDMLGQASDGMVWRMGMNEATVLETAANLTFGETAVAAGRYTLWMQKTADGWDLLVNSNAAEGMWGAPAPSDGVVASTSFAISASETSVEKFTMEVAASDDSNGSITVSWDKMVLTASFGVSAE